MGKRTITLTGRAPVTIVEAAWPTIAQSDWDSWGSSGDYCRREQALAQGEIDTATLRVRQHADGRSIVYGVFNGATPWTGSVDRKAGELLAAGEDIPRAIERVGAYIGLADSEMLDECVASLPAVVLD